MHAQERKYLFLQGIKVKKTGSARDNDIMYKHKNKVINTHNRTHTHTHTHTHIHTYIHTPTHKHSQTHTYTQNRGSIGEGWKFSLKWFI